MFNTESMGKSAETRTRISEVALASFRERGYDATTIRLIATEAGVSVGNAYYYFPTKNHLVQELYRRVQDDHLAAAGAALDGVTDLSSRLEIALHTGLDQLAPYHQTAPGFLAAAISPDSPVNPFGDEATEARDAAVAAFELVVRDARTVMPAELRQRLPELLWLGYMALALHFVYDRSPGQEKSRRLATRASRLLATLLPLTRLPFARKPLLELLDLIAEVRS